VLIPLVWVEFIVFTIHYELYIAERVEQEYLWGRHFSSESDIGDSRYSFLIFTREKIVVGPAFAVCVSFKKLQSA
jgi:hypothetical protein